MGSRTINSIAADNKKFQEIKDAEKKLEREFPELSHPFSKGEIRTLANSQEVDPFAAIRLIEEVVDLFQSSSLSALRGRKAVFVVGMTGAGKSTFCNWLAGHDLKIEEPESDDSDDDAPPQVVVVPKEGLDAPFDIGHSLQKSATFLPTIRCISDDMVLVDFPGYFDSNGFEIRIGMDLAFKQLLTVPASAHVLALVPIGGFGSDGRSKTAIEQLEKLRRLCPTGFKQVGPSMAEDPNLSTDNRCKITLGITRAHKKFTKGSKQLMKNAEAVVAAFDPFFTEEDSVINITELVFPKSQAAQDSRASFLEGVSRTVFPKSELKQKDSRASFLEKIVQRRVFPNTSYDCLDIQAVDALRSYLCSAAFFQKINQDLAETKDISAPKVELTTEEKAAWVSEQVDKLLCRAGRLRKNIGDNTAKIVRASKDLKENGVLLLQSEYQTIQSLVKFDQPRLTFAFLEAEKCAMSGLIAINCKGLVKIEEGMKAMSDAQLVKKEDLERFETEMLKVKRQLETLATSQGYKDLKEMQESWSTKLHFVIAAAGGATATSTFCGMAAVTTLAEMSGLAMVGLAGGVFLLVGGLVAAGISIKNAGWFTEKSKKLVDTQINAVKAIGEAVKAQEEHNTTMTKLKNDLEQRCIH